MTSEQVTLEALLEVARHRYSRRRNPARVYVQGFGTAVSRHTMRRALEHLARIASGGELPADVFPWHRLQYEDTRALRAHLAEHQAPAYTNKHLVALRGILRTCWRLRLMSGEEYQHAADLPSVKGSHLLRGRALTPGELVALFEVCRADSRPVGRRDAAMFALAYGAALRRAELVALNLADYDREGSRLVVPGKGQRQRALAIVGRVQEALEAWLAVRGRRAGALFVRVDRAGLVSTGRLTAGAVRHVCDRRGKAARLPFFSPHDLRRSSASDLFDAGDDPLTVKQFLGHAKVETTAKYDRRGERATRKAAGHLHVPL